MRLSVKNERPLYNAYRGDGIRRRARTVFVPSIRNLISHESERRPSPFARPFSPTSPVFSSSAVFFRRFFLFCLLLPPPPSLFLSHCARKANRRSQGTGAPELLFSRLSLNVDNVGREVFHSDELSRTCLVSLGMSMNEHVVRYVYVLRGIVVPKLSLASEIVEFRVVFRTDT